MHNKTPEEVFLEAYVQPDAQYYAAPGEGTWSTSLKTIRHFEILESIETEEWDKIKNLRI